MKSPGLVISTLARRLLERLTRNWVYRRRLPNPVRRASIYVTPSAGLKYLVKSMSRVDPSLVRNARELVRADNVVWDVGANIGYFSFISAALSGPGGRVIAFEPDIWLTRILLESRKIQPGSSAPISVIPVAIGANTSVRKLHISARSRASNALEGRGRSQAGATASIEPVVTVNLDWLLGQLSPPHVLKIDVEGAEVEVLENQAAFLQHARPVIICEVGAKCVEAITTILKSANYRMFDGDKPLSLSSEISSAAWSTIANPMERCSDYVGA